MTGAFAESFENLDKPVIAGFEILAVLGSGGHSKVYRARAQSGREVAIKRWLHPELGLDPERDQARRMRREAKALKRLDHPGLCRFRGLVRDAGGRPCLVMDLVEGPSLLAEIEEQGPASAERAIALGIGLCEALEHLHQRGLVHRDVKPANVIIRRDDGRPVLVDLSIVQVTGAARTQRLTLTGQMLGTAPYMAPEQCGAEVEGSELATDPRTDVYGLGALLFHALTGRPPWRNESPWERLERNPWERPYPSDRKARAAIERGKAACPEALAAVIARCLEGEPEARFQDAAALRSALVGCRSGSAAPRIGRGLGLTAGVLLIGLFALGIFFRLTNQDGAPAPNSSQTRDEPVRQEAELKKTAGIAAVTTALAMTTAQAGTVDTRPYAPMKKGYSWRYSMGTTNAGKRLVVATTTIEILERVRRDGREFFLHTQSYETDIPKELLEGPEGQPNPFSKPTRSLVGYDDAALISVPEKAEPGARAEVLLPRRLKKGQVWKSKAELDAFSTFEGYADIEVGAKKYRRCLKVSTLVVLKGEADKRIAYYARGVGLVCLTMDRMTMELTSFQKSARAPTTAEVEAATRSALEERAAAVLAERAEAVMAARGLRLKRSPIAADIKDARGELSSVELVKSEGKSRGRWRFKLAFAGRFRGTFSMLELDERLDGQARAHIVRDAQGRFEVKELELLPTSPQAGAPSPEAKTDPEAPPSKAEVEACARAYVKANLAASFKRSMKAAAEAEQDEKKRRQLELALKLARYKVEDIAARVSEGPKRVARGWSVVVDNSFLMRIEVLGQREKTEGSWSGPAILARGPGGAWAVVEESFSFPKKK